MARPTPVVTLDAFQLQVVAGTLLGDSSLSKPASGKNYHLSCYHAEAQREWLILKHSWLSPASRPIHWCAYTDRRDGKTRKGGRFHTVSIPQFTAFAELLYDAARVKVVTATMLGLISHPVALACLICDDGGWDRAGISIASKQFSLTENRLLAEWLRQTYGLSVGSMEGGKYPHLRITAASVQRARDLCLQFVPECMRYKFGPDGYKTRLTGLVAKPCQKCGEEFFSYASEGKSFCSRACAAKGRPSGYATRTKRKECERCHSSFVIYNRRQRFCAACR